MVEAALAGILIGLASIMGYFLWTGVAPVPSSPQEIRAVVALLREAGISSTSRIYELGCGWASLMIGLADAFPEASIVGVEISPLPYLVAKARTFRNPKLTVLRRDFRDLSLSDADVVAVYLGIKSIAALSSRLDETLRPRTFVVSLCFLFRDRQPTKILPLAVLGNQAALYIWPAISRSR